MNLRYNPFNCDLADVIDNDLSSLRDVPEGWYVEYKSREISAKAFGKSLSAFANQYGGWLIIGVVADSDTLRPTSFVGVSDPQVSLILESLRNAARDTVNPEVYYEARVFAGPIATIELPAQQSLILVRIPPGANPPYVHIDGRIYRRVADSSAPKPETDRFILDSMWRKAERAQEQLRKFVTRDPVTSQAEENSSFIHLSILSDLHLTKGHWYSGLFADFASQMRKTPIPFDNFFTHAQGFVARQVAHNQPNRRLLTWEFCRNCDSFVTIPLNVYESPFEFMDYSTGNEFINEVTKANLSGVRYLDLNIIFACIQGITAMHRDLVASAGVTGPFYVKAHLQNVWRTVPFIDMISFVEHIRQHGIPVIQDGSALVPFGMDPVTFTELDECNIRPVPIDISITDPIKISIPIFQALGVSGELFIEGRTELISIGERYQHAQSRRQPKSE